MTASYEGHYPIESRQGEIKRLHIQDVLKAPETENMFALIGLEKEWSFLDIGCGPRSLV